MKRINTRIRHLIDSAILAAMVTGAVWYLSWISRPPDLRPAKGAPNPAFKTGPSVEEAVLKMEGREGFERAFEE
jgi:hypothetical protein